MFVVTPLQTSMELLSKRGIELTRGVSITTDRALAMVGREKGTVARLKEDNLEVISYHCIIHQVVLWSTLSDEYVEVMNTVMMQVCSLFRI